jgi:Cu+-exporting ATPase
MTTEPNQAIDPVCNMTINVNSTHSELYKGTRYYFCSPECHATFIAAPDAFAPAASNTTASREHHHGCC